MNDPPNRAMGFRVDQAINQAIEERRLVGAVVFIGAGGKEDGPYRRLGVSDGLDAAGPSLDENIRRIAAAPLVYRPGTKWGYSLSIDVLGAVIEKVRDSNLPQIVAD